MATLTGLTFDGTSSLDVTSRTVTYIGGAEQSEIRFDGTSRLTVRLPDANYPNPATNRVEYRVVVCNKGGTQYAELENAKLGSVVWKLGEVDSFSFDIPGHDPKVFECEAPEREAQLWRGKRLIHWGVLVRGKGGDGVVNFQVPGLDWYFKRRHMGAVPQENLLRNGRFQNGVGWGWNYLCRKGTEPGKPPIYQLTREVTFQGEKSLLLSPSTGFARDVYDADDLFTTTDGDTLSSAGETVLDSIATLAVGENPHIGVSVHHDNRGSDEYVHDITRDRANVISDYLLTQKAGANIKAVGRGDNVPIATNATVAGRASNRRVVFTYKDTDGIKGHGQHARQRVEVQNKANDKKKMKVTLRGWFYLDSYTGPAYHHRGLCLVLRHPFKKNPNPKYDENKIVKIANAPITNETPINRWVRVEVSVNVPADGKKYTAESQIWCPNGIVMWDELSLTENSAFVFSGDEQARILRTLVRHAQDESMGKSDLNIEARVPQTGVMRDRTYEWWKREQIYDCLAEFNTLAEGGEWAMEYTPEGRRWLQHYYPRKGEHREDIPLVLGKNIATYDVSSDAEQTSTTVIIVHEGEGSDREEWAAYDDTILDGLVLEKVYDATPGSSVGSLRKQAERGLGRYRRNVVIPSVTSNPKDADDMFRLQTGDRVDVDIVDGWVEAQDLYRIQSITLDPNTDQFTFDLTPEDIGIKVIVPFGSDGWKYTHSLQTVTRPSETHPEWAAEGFDDSGWTSTEAPIGWVQPGSVIDTLPDHPPATTVADKHEVWMRRTVKVTRDLIVSALVDRWAYLYVNGNLVKRRDGTKYHYGIGQHGAAGTGPIRVPHEFLNPSGVQTIMLHVQGALNDYGGPDISMSVADVKVRGIYDPDEVV